MLVAYAVAVVLFLLIRGILLELNEGYNLYCLSDLHPTTKCHEEWKEMGFST